MQVFYTLYIITFDLFPQNQQRAVIAKMTSSDRKPRKSRPPIQIQTVMLVQEKVKVKVSVYIHLSIYINMHQIINLSNLKLVVTAMNIFSFITHIFLQRKYSVNIVSFTLLLQLRSLQQTTCSGRRMTSPQTATQRSLRLQASPWYCDCPSSRTGPRVMYLKDSFLTKRF